MQTEVCKLSVLIIKTEHTDNRATGSFGFGTLRHLLSGTYWEIHEDKTV